VIAGDEVTLQVFPTDPEDVPTCRILGPDGEVLAEETSDYPGLLALCRYE